MFISSYVPVSCAKIPDDPVQFSFWILINFPMSDAIRCEMLALNNSLQRLKILIEYFKTVSFKIWHVFL